MEHNSDIIDGKGNVQHRPTTTEAEIAVRAYELWQMAGAPSGRDREYWFMAEGELQAEKHPSPAWEDTARKQATPDAVGE